MKKELAEKESQLSIKPAEKAVDDELSWLNTLSHETSENVQERINLQKALYELEETNLRNRTELQHLDDAIAKQQVALKQHTYYMVILLDMSHAAFYWKILSLLFHCANLSSNLEEEKLFYFYFSEVRFYFFFLVGKQGWDRLEKDRERADYFLRTSKERLLLECYADNEMHFSMSQAIEKDGSVVEALRARRQVILDNIRDNDEAGVNYQKVNVSACTLTHKVIILTAIYLITDIVCRKLNPMRSIDASSKI